MTKKQLEEKYGVQIVWDYFLEEYKIYSADDCPWDKGFRTIKQVEAECREWEKELLAIKESVKGGK